MTQLALSLVARAVACSWVQSTADLALPATTPCVLAVVVADPRRGVLRQRPIRAQRLHAGALRAAAV